MGNLYKLLLLWALVMLCAHGTRADSSDGNFYLAVGAGYKLEEHRIVHNGEAINDPITARIEVGYQLDGWSAGVTHRSQWFSGWPVNDSEEYNVTELFIEYRWVW